MDDNKIDYKLRASTYDLEPINLSAKEVDDLCVKMAKALCEQLFKDGKLSLQEITAIRKHSEKG